MTQEEALKAWADGIRKSTFYMSNPDWVWYDEDERPHLTDKAPPEAVESYEYAMKKLKRQEENGIIYN